MEANQDPKVYTPPILETLSDCTISAHSNVGTVRKENQDYMGFVGFGDYRLLVVCDGMGGHSGGFEASRMAVAAIIDFVPALIDDLGIEGALSGAIENANQKLQDYAKEFPQFKGMGTTAVVCLMKGGQLWLAHVGDSRAYLVRNDEVILLTYDHTCINRLVLMGKVSFEESIDHPIGHILERSVGVEAMVVSELNDEEIWLQKGDQILLCSDGFSGLAVDDDILTLCKSDEPLDERVEKMIEFSLNRQADDNVTIGVLEYAEDGFPDKPAPEDKRNLLRGVTLDFEEIADIETADPPDELPQSSPIEEESTVPFPVSDAPSGSSHWPLVIVALLVVIGIGYGVYNQLDKAQQEQERIERRQQRAGEIEKLTPDAEKYGLTVPNKPYPKGTLRSLKSDIDRQKQFERQMEEFKDAVNAFGLIFPTPPHNKTTVKTLRTKVSEQETFKARLMPYIKIAQISGMDLIKPPYDQNTVEAFIAMVQKADPDAPIPSETMDVDAPSEAPEPPVTPEPSEAPEANGPTEASGTDQAE